MQTFPFRFFALVLVVLASCTSEKKAPDNVGLFAKENLLAWCVVPFDSVQRTPKERADMLQSLGFKQFAYDWRPQHLPTFSEEIKELKQHDIKLKSVWMWIDADTGKIIDSDNEKLLSIIKENNVHTDLWLGFSNKHFEGLSDEEKLDKAVTSVSYIRDWAKEAGCSISLYNHGDWFGDPVNQVRIIEKLGTTDVGIVYNFHHAHLQVKQFPDLLAKMLPYLNTVNLNGMRVEGPKILTIGEGNEELSMLKTLKNSGYAGSIGIICHIETEDAGVVLQRNVNGLKSLLKIMNDEKALATY